LVTAEFLDARLKLAHLPGAHATFLKALRSGLGLRGFPMADVAALQAALPSVKAPALVIWGKQDKFLSFEHSAILKRLLPKVRVDDQCGHLPLVVAAGERKSPAHVSGGLLEHQN
jgi:pimeloyl-ACP methyl ester carboxylesterase